jgi:hypothetical protein
MSVVDLLRSEGARLSARVIDDMFQDPFWIERFGERGRNHSHTDGRYHISYLIEALTAGDATLFATYARWLRDLLVARGMCSRHLEDNFLRLGAAITAEHWDGGEHAVAVLHQGAAALRRTEGAAAVIDHARAPVAAAAAAASPTTTADEMAVLLSYLADSLAAGGPERLLGYVDHLRRVGRDVGLDVALAALAAAIEGKLDGDAGQATVFLEAARQTARGAA